MRAVVIDKAYSVKIIEKEKPVIEHGKQVLIKVKSVGICGSDVHIYHGTNPLATYPRTIGHEFAGEIVEIGSEVKTLKVGDRVSVEPIIFCGDCYACNNGQPNVCAELEVMGVHRDGGMQDYVVVNEEKAHILPEKTPWEVACLIEPFTIGAQSTNRADIKPGDTVLVFGAGTIGLTVLQNAKNRGARVIITDIDDDKLEFAKKQGADEVINVRVKNLKDEIMRLTDGYGPNVSIDAACLKETLEQAVELTSPAGRVVVLGFALETCDIAPYYITKKQLRIIGSRLEYKQFPYVIEEYKKGNLNLGALISHKLPLEDVKKGLEILSDPNVKTTKVVLLLD